MTERADSLSSSPPPPDRRRRGGGTSEDDVVYDDVVYDVNDETTKKTTMETQQMEKMKRKMHLLQQELRAKDDMLEAVQSQAKLDIVNARTRVDSIEEKREELEARCAKAEKLALERTNALETANKKVKEAERSAKVFMQRANAKISEALRENSSNTISKDAAENRELKNASSSSPSKIERKLTPSNLSLQEKILRIEERQQMEDEEGLMSIHNNNNTATTTTSSSSPLAANDNRVIKQNEEDKEEDKSNKEQTDMNQKQIEESLRNEIQQLLTQNADAARSFQDSLEIERNKRREAEERAEMSEAACVRLQSELRSKESLLKMMETTRSTGDKSETTALRARILNDEVEANATSASPPTTAKIEQVLQKIQRPRRKEGKEEESDDDDNDDDDDDDEIPSFSPVKSPPPPPRKY